MGFMVSVDNKFRTIEDKQKGVAENSIEIIYKGVEENQTETIYKEVEENQTETIYNGVEENLLERFSTIHKEVYDLANSNEPISEKVKHALKVIEESLMKYGYDLT